MVLRTHPLETYRSTHIHTPHSYTTGNRQLAYNTCLWTGGNLEYTEETPQVRREDMNSILVIRCGMQTPNPRDERRQRNKDRNMENDWAT